MLRDSCNVESNFDVLDRCFHSTLGNELPSHYSLYLSNEANESPSFMRT